MTGAVALSIGSLMGSVINVDRSVSKECIGRFLRVKVSLNVKEPLMRGTHVQFPDEGKLWVKFRYESLPNYCLLCGLLGHPTRICKVKFCPENKEKGEGLEGSASFPFQNLDAVTDLKGISLPSGNRNRSGSGEVTIQRGPNGASRAGTRGVLEWEA